MSIIYEIVLTVTQTKKLKDGTEKSVNTKSIVQTFIDVGEEYAMQVCDSWKLSHPEAGSWSWTSRPYPSG